MGVPIEQDPDHVICVITSLDALTNYLSSLNYPDLQNDTYKDFWPADLHMVGKDILRFHAVYWPTFLMAAELPLPKKEYLPWMVDK